MEKIAGRFWKAERFSWPFVLSVAYAALALFVIDWAWRTIEVPAGAFAASAIAFFAMGAVGLAVSFRAARRPGA